MKYLITILATARSGSNYLCDLLGNTFSSVNSNGELFCYNDFCFINAKYLKTMQNVYKCEGDLIKYADKDPMLFLNNLMNISQEPIISHKLFESQVELNIVFKIIDKSEFLIIMKRNPIDMYISYKKASEMEQKNMYDDPWCNVDTTNYKIIFNITEFEEREHSLKSWYEKIFNYISKMQKKYCLLDYDDFHKLNLFEQQLLIKKNISEVIPSDLLNINTNITTIKKQDRSVNYKDKIINYDEVSNYIIEFKI